MSPVFRHGRLRLYLLRLLDEEPRHGYEVIRMLRDRFMGVYAPSPGTIYPRLARLEEEGLVTHDEIDGRKVYKITDAGREELRERDDELAELEDELAESVSDIVREVGEDVRETVRSLREELTRAARAAWRGEERRPGWPGEQGARENARLGRESARARCGQAPPGWSPRNRGRWDTEPGGAGWGEWPSAPGRPGWPGWRNWQERHGGSGGPETGVIRDLERIVREFTGDLGRLAWQAGASLRRETLSGLRSILDDTLDRISAEIFGAAAPRTGRSGTGNGHDNPDPRTGTGTGADDLWGQATGADPEAGGQPGSGAREPGAKG
ncbi:MAG TPA: PadR family transcriptional regulator [Streptosporangiaceae bacterium]|nr:PadR family transcriptional regulator [Streptosporangiaceae bacterium]